MGKVFDHVLLHSSAHAGRSKVNSLQGCKPRKLHEIAVVPRDRPRFPNINLGITEINPVRFEGVISLPVATHFYPKTLQHSERVEPHQCAFGGKSRGNLA